MNVWRFFEKKYQKANSNNRSGIAGKRIVAAFLCCALFVSGCGISGTDTESGSLSGAMENFQDTTAENDSHTDETDSSQEGPVTVLTTARVNLRAAPSIESRSYGKLDPGTEVERISDSGEWSEVNYNGSTCYIASQYLYDSSASEIPQLAFPAEIPEKAGWIFNTQKNELGTYEGGEPGDQNGKEARIEAYPSYYKVSSYPWEALFRCKDRKLAETAAQMACAAAANENIGYDSGDQRLTIWEEAEKADYDVSKIATLCAANCVTSLLTIYKCAGEKLGIRSVAKMEVDAHVSTEAEILLATGFFEKVDDADLYSPDGNYAGDVYLAESHTILQITDGKDIATEE